MGTTAATREWTAAAAANWQKKKKLEERKRGRGTSTPSTTAVERLRGLTRDAAGAKRPRAAAAGEVTGDEDTDVAADMRSTGSRDRSSAGVNEARRRGGRGK